MRFLELIKRIMLGEGAFYGGLPMKVESLLGVALRRTIIEFIDAKARNTASTSNSTCNALTPTALRGVKEQA